MAETKKKTVETKAVEEKVVKEVKESKEAKELREVKAELEEKKAEIVSYKSRIERQEEEVARVKYTCKKSGIVGAIGAAFAFIFGLIMTIICSDISANYKEVISIGAKDVIYHNFNLFYCSVYWFVFFLIGVVVFAGIAFAVRRKK